MRDVLDLFGELPDYPGKTKPRNRVETKRSARDSIDDPFEGVPSKIAKIGGESVELFTVGAVGKILGRTANTIRQWEAKGWIPSASYRSPRPSGSKAVNTSVKGYRYYSRPQVEVLLRVLRECNLQSPRGPHWQNADSWVSFIERIKAEWPK